MNIRKTWNRFISMVLVFVMVLSIAPVQLLQSDSKAYGSSAGLGAIVAGVAGMIGSGTGQTGMTGGGAWRANWTTDKQGVDYNKLSCTLVL